MQGFGQCIMDSGCESAWEILDNVRALWQITAINEMVYAARTISSKGRRERNNSKDGRPVRMEKKKKIESSVIRNLRRMPGMSEVYCCFIRFKKLLSCSASVELICEEHSCIRSVFDMG